MRRQGGGAGLCLCAFAGAARGCGNGRTRSASPRLSRRQRHHPPQTSRYALLDEIDRAAAAIGAVNTIVVEQS